MLVTSSLPEQRSQGKGICHGRNSLCPRHRLLSDEKSFLPGLTRSARMYGDISSHDEYHARWELLWMEGIERGENWDTRASPPALVELVRTGSLGLSGKRAIVPGCGRGYDVLLLAGEGSDALGLEISQTAVEVACKYRDSLNIPDSHKIKANYRVGDFFAYKDGLFDIGFDHNFFCAIHPSMRVAWAKSWSDIIAPGGELVTLLYPVDSTRVGGPPFYTDPNEAKKLLEEHGFECKHLGPVDPNVSIPYRAGKEYLGRWIRRVESHLKAIIFDRSALKAEP